VIARKIFEDLVYLDQDELKISEFLKRLWRSFTMIEITLGTFQAISSGIHEFEYNHWIDERFTDPFLHVIDHMIGYVVAGILVFFLRKAHRNRVICWLLAAQLLNSALRHAFVGVHYKH
ncbi:hypothetical protein PENTCL1PPCAC_5590, partial [Pristionchus entomophagus]